MDPKFQSSFIPKKPLIAEAVHKTHSSVSFFFIISLVLFMLSLGSVGLVYAWEKVLLTSQDTYKADLQKNRDAFGDEQLGRFRRVNTKIDLAKNHLDSYIAVSTIFPILSEITTDVVRYSSFEYVPPSAKGDPVKIILTGEAAGFNAIAFQSDIFAQAMKMKNIIMTDFDLNENGNVSFSMTGEIPRENVYYKNLFGQPSDVTTPSTDEGALPDAQDSSGAPVINEPSDTIPLDELPTI